VSVADSVKRGLAAARERSRLFDHLIATFEHYSKVECSVLAGAVTFFGFLSFFPILAIAFSIVGVVTGAYPDAEQSVTDALHAVFPRMIGSEDGQIDPTEFKDAAATAGAIGVLTLLYTGLGWLSTLRKALQNVFELPSSKAHNYVVGKLVDLFVLGLIGLVLFVSVALSSVVTGLVDEILESVSLDDVGGMNLVFRVGGIVLGLAASTLMFYIAFRLLAKPTVSSGALWHGAALAAVGFELLKLAASYLISLTKEDPAFAVFGTALILLVWINFFSRLVLLGAAWAVTSDRATPREAASAAASYAALVSATSARDDALPAEELAAEEAERVEAGTEMVRSAAVVLGVTWLLRRSIRRKTEPTDSEADAGVSNLMLLRRRERPRLPT
jgi:membrane protein